VGVMRKKLMELIDRITKALQGNRATPVAVGS
jgi:hypothetical protein